MTVSVDTAIPDLEVEAWVRDAEVPQSFTLSAFRGQ